MSLLHAHWVGSGNGTTLVSLLLPLEQLNARLAAVVYVPPMHFFGNATVTIDVNDRGNSGRGGPLVDSQTITIVVSPVNDPPVLRANVSALLEPIAEDTPDADNIGTSVHGLACVPLISDVDTTDALGIAVVSADDTRGQWQFARDDAGTIFDTMICAI